MNMYDLWICDLNILAIHFLLELFRCISIRYLIYNHFYLFSRSFIFSISEIYFSYISAQTYWKGGLD